MKKELTILLLLLSLVSYAQFDSLFFNKTLRIDYENVGNSDTSIFALKEVKIEPYWGGSHTNLVDTFEYGYYYFKVFDKKTEELLYSRGYSSLFAEWQVIEEAKSIRRSFSESVVMPLPKEAVRIDFFKRSSGVFKLFYSYDYDPNNYFIGENQFRKYPVFEPYTSGDPADKVDIVFIPEGYTNDEMGKFFDDCTFFTEEFFKYKPYSDMKDKFNFHAVLAPSHDSGPDIPKEGVFHNTLLDMSFYTFGTERYLMTDDFSKVRDVAANAPYDQIYILINTDKYGGGAIYNYYNTCINGNPQASQVFVHEFGHGFVGLGDEYGYDDNFGEMYSKNREPWEANLTTLVDFDSKWKDKVEKGTPIPTPLGKEYEEKIGAFEGAGYVSKGVYRPSKECLMRSFRKNVFCEVCEDAIRNMVLFYSE